MAATSGTAGKLEHEPAYLMAMSDWLACAAAGANERAPRAVRGAGGDLLGEIAFAATAGHVLDFDDTFADGVAHVSATTAPAALGLAADRGLSLREALYAYAGGYEAMAAVAAASHPALYDAGWHPTAVCGPIGAVVAASRLLGLTAPQRQNAIAIALLRAGGTRGAFGSDGKAIQVGLATAAGVQAALMAQAGAVVDPRAIHGPQGFSAVIGAAWADPGGQRLHSPAITRNWIKLHPSCLGTHSPIDAAARAHQAGRRLDHGQVQVTVHPVARQAAHLDAVSDGLSAKFSIPYCVAHTFLQGPPGVSDFISIDETVSDAARSVSVTVDESLPEFGAVLTSAREQLVRIDCPRGAPDQPLAEAELEAKIASLAGERLLEALNDLARPAADALQAADLRRGPGASGKADLRTHFPPG
jgi:2-methylcitrate dehydratase PrpD